jgi:hypothetical protein
MEIKGRLRHWKAVLWGPLLKILGSLYAILGLASLVRGEFFPDKGGPLIGFIPAWTSATWLALGLTLIVIVTLEGSYRVVSAMTRGADRQIEELTALRANGVRLYAAQVKDGTALGAWVARRQEWERLLFPLLGSRFGPATRNRVEYLGALPGAAFEHAYDSNHNHELMILSRRLELLDEILREAK